jgi:hypothetical protein
MRTYYVCTILAGTIRILKYTRFAIWHMLPKGQIGVATVVMDKSLRGFYRAIFLCSERDLCKQDRHYGAYKQQLSAF